MSILRAVKFMFSSKGFNKGLHRLSTVRKRFGFTPEKQIDCIRYYASLLEGYGLKATFFVPAKILEKYIQAIRLIGKDNIEWGVHGYIHLDISKLTINELRRHIVEAIRIFDSCGIAFNGFRAPYLRPGNYLMDILVESGRFLYNSSNSILWDNVCGSKKNVLDWSKEFYSPALYSQQPPISYGKDRLIDLPVSLPDDDILIDREKFNSVDVLSIWKNMLRICHRDNELFILQLHPERIHILRDTLRSLIEEARNLNPPIWMTTLADVANWRKMNSQGQLQWPKPCRGAFCITGDIDSLTVRDFIER